MKNYLVLSLLALSLASCDSKKDAEQARKNVLDSVNAVNLAAEQKQHTIDSMNAITKSTHKTEVQSNGETTTTNTTETTQKKKMSNKTKGALIGGYSHQSVPPILTQTRPPILT